MESLDQILSDLWNAANMGHGTLLDLRFPQQAKFVEDKSRFVAAQCTRRAGKSNGLGYRFLRTALKYPNAVLPYIALTRDSAKNIMWPIFRDLCERHNIPADFTDSNLTVQLKNGARIVCYGADMQNFIRRLRGGKYPFVAVDEAQSFGQHLGELMDDVLAPALADYEDGSIAITGTPGPIPKGFFYDACMGKLGFSVHKWSVYDNPYMPNAKAFVEDMKKRRAWDSNHPTLLREWENKWVLDQESLLIKYDKERNHYETLPARKWNYILGIDLGYNDADALAVLAWSEADPNTYLVEEVITKGQGLTELVEQIRHISAKYDIAKMVIDEGGLGKKMAEEMRRRYHIPVQAADKARKMETVEILNDTLRLGRFKAKKDSRFAQDSYLVQIDWEASTPDRIAVKDSFHSDIIDATLYAFKESPAFTYQKPKAAPLYKSEEWAREQVTEMERQAEEFFQAQEDADKGFGLETLGY